MLRIVPIKKNLGTEASWEEIHENFKYESKQTLWIEHGFDCQTTKEWKEALGWSFKVDDWAFCVWLRDKKLLTSQEIKQQNNTGSLREEYNKLWTDISEEFARYRQKGQTNQQLWEDEGFTYSETYSWIQAGFEPSDDTSLIKQWKNCDFTPQQTAEWVKLGLKPNEHKNFKDIFTLTFVVYLRQKGYRPSKDLNLEQLREEYIIWKKNLSAQEYLNRIYPLEERDARKRLDIRSKKLTGILDLTDFVNLEFINCCDNQLTSLNIRNCQKLREIYCSFNQLTDLELVGLTELEKIECDDNYLTNFDCSVLNPEKLTWLNISDNNLTEQDCSVFSQFINLELLWIGGNNQDHLSKNIYNKFFGSLQSLQNLTKLKSLLISNTDIDNELEWLASSIEEIYCSSKERPESKVKKIEEKIKKSSIFFTTDADSEDKYKKFWDNIHLGFTPELQIEWEDREFTARQCKNWMDAGLEPTDFDYAWWLKYTKQPDDEQILNHDNKKKLRKEYKEFLEEINKGSKLGLKVIKRIKKISHIYLRSEQEILLEKLIPNKELRERYSEYGLCPKCWQPNTFFRNWCQSCNAQRWQEEFKNWTSNNPEVDGFIQKSQLNATSPRDVLELIPYKQFIDIKYLAKGGFGTVYKAKWISRPISNWNIETKKWERNKLYSDGDEVVFALKVLDNSQNITTEFLKEIANHHLLQSKSETAIVQCYGISQDPITKNYIIVMKHMSKGDLLQYLHNYHEKLTVWNKFRQLYYIADGLKTIHQQGLVHRDFHMGNVLVEEINENNFASCITDLGLSRPASEKDQSKVYGVLPYVAPELLKHALNSEQGTPAPYSQEADIYSFGMVAYGIFSNFPPYHGKKNSGYLVLEICDENQPLRPSLNDMIAPQLLKDLIQQCLDANPSKRPTAKKLYENLSDWHLEIDEDTNTEFARQLRESEEKNKLAIFSSRHLPYPQVFRISHLLDSKNLSVSQNNPDQEWQTTTSLELQIKSIEREIEVFKESLNNELKKLVEKFVEIKKKLIKDKENEELENKAWDLEDKLEAKDLAREKIDKIIRHCEDLVELEKQRVEREKLQVNIEMPTNNNNN